MTQFERSRMTSYSHSIVTLALACTISEIQLQTYKLQLGVMPAEALRGYIYGQRASLAIYVLWFI